MPITASNPIALSLANAIALANGYNIVGSVPNNNNNPGYLKNGDVGFGVDSMRNTVYGTSEMGNIALQAQAAHILNGDNKTFSYDPNKTPLSIVGAILAPNDATWIKNVSASLGVNPATKLGAIASGSTRVTPALQILPSNKLALQGTLPGQVQPSDAASAGNSTSPLGFDVTAAVPVAGATVYSSQAVQANAVSQNLQISDASMSAAPWYQDHNLLTGNQRIRDSVLPVAFQVYLSKSSNSLLINPMTKQPITLRLNASITQITILSKHVVNRQPTRTGMLVTFWGMAADTISGTASTGVFINQLGVTDYFSTAKATDDITTKIGMAYSNDPDVEMAVAANPEAYRVAAQDGFMEFLKLFQMNGNVWYTSATTTDPTQLNQSQVAPAVWQQNAGATNIQQNARNNDVRSKGYVVMSFRNNLYLGYFKSLSWTMDAEKPFQWVFNFTFQVERTLTAYYYPIAPAAPTVTNVPINTHQTPTLALPSPLPPGPSTGS
jgi:hypothetical protein